VTTSTGPDNSDKRLATINIFDSELKCPWCNAKLSKAIFASGTPYICTSCSEPLQLAAPPVQYTVFLPIPLAVIVSLIFGFRGLHLGIAALLLYFPAIFVVTYFAATIRPLKLEPYTGSKGEELKQEFWGAPITYKITPGREEQCYDFWWIVVGRPETRLTSIRPPADHLL
jgi:hypothetical protein